MRLLAATSMIGAGAGILVRLTVRDATLPTAVVFYATPWPVIVAMLAAPAVVAGRAGRRGVALMLGAAALASAAAAVRQDWGGSPCRIAPPPAAGEAGENGVRVLFWNCEHGRFGWEAIAASIRAQDADVVGLVEAGRAGVARARFWREHLPGYEVWLPGRGLVLLVRGTIESGRVHDLAGRGEMASARASVRGLDLMLVLVDIHSSPVLDRSLPVNELARLVSGRTDRARIMMGDFNTPLDSVWLHPLRARFTPAFEEAGSGWGPTWPGPLPVMTLDQIWVAPPARAVCTSARFTTRSDHKQVLAEIAIDAPRPEAPRAAAAFPSLPVPPAGPPPGAQAPAEAGSTDVTSASGTFR